MGARVVVGVDAGRTVVVGAAVVAGAFVVVGATVVVVVVVVVDVVEVVDVVDVGASTVVVVASTGTVVTAESVTSPFWPPTAPTPATTTAAGATILAHIGQDRYIPTARLPTERFPPSFIEGSIAHPICESRSPSSQLVTSSLDVPWSHYRNWAVRRHFGNPRHPRKRVPVSEFRRTTRDLPQLQRPILVPTCGYVLDFVADALEPIADAIWRGCDVVLLSSRSSDGLSPAMVSGDGGVTAARLAARR